MSYKDLFPLVTTLPTTSPIPADVGDISLRDEIISILYGTDGEIAKGQKFILRRMRRNSSNEIVKCECVHTITREHDIDYYCHFCQSEGSLFDEELITGYKVNQYTSSLSNSNNLSKLIFGQYNEQSMIFYFDYSINPKREDKIIVIELDLEGNPVLPYNRLFNYEINQIRDMRADRGRVEYWICQCHPVSMKTKANQ